MEKQTKFDPNVLNAQVLAFMGDAVYSLYARKHFVTTEGLLAGKLHLKCNDFVKAEGQAKALDRISKLLTPEEADIVRRGRNVKTNNIAKNSSLEDYKKATGFEALIGYLYLQNRVERVEELILIGSNNFARGDIK